MHGKVLPQAWREVEIRSQDEWKLSVSREEAHVLHQFGVEIAAETDGVLEISCKQQSLSTHDTNDPRGLGQRTPVSSVHTDRCLENQRMCTSASTPAHAPLFAVLIAALPVPAHENFLASLAAVTSFSLSKLVSKMRAASKSDVRMQCLACSPQVVTLHWRIFTTPLAISSIRFLPMSLRPPLLVCGKRVISFLSPSGSGDTGWANRSI